MADHLSAAARNEVSGAGDRASLPNRKRDPWREGWRLGLPPRNSILNVEDRVSLGGPETGDSACRVAAREARNEAWSFAFPSGKFAAWWRYSGGTAGSTGVLGGGFPARWYEQLCGGPGRCAAVPERTVALQELTLRWQPVPLRAGPRSGSEATHPGGYPFSRPLAATPSTSASPTWRRVRGASAAARRRDGASLAEDDGLARPGDARPHRHAARYERATQRCGPFDDDARVSSTARAAADLASQAGRRSAILPRAAINDRACAMPPWRCHSMRPTSSRDPSLSTAPPQRRAPRRQPR